MASIKELRVKYVNFDKEYLKMKNKDLYNEIKSRLELIYLSHDNLAKEAYYLWQEGGSLDGNEKVDTVFGYISRKDYYWNLAVCTQKILLEIDVEYYFERCIDEFNWTKTNDLV